MVLEVTSIIMTSYLFVRELLVLVDVDLLESFGGTGPSAVCTSSTSNTSVESGAMASPEHINHLIKIYPA